MHPRSAAHVLLQIASYLELRGESTFKVRAYAHAARALGELQTDDLSELDRTGSLAGVRGLGKATLGVIHDLVESGESSYLKQLEEEIPAGLLELLKIPGLGTQKIRFLHAELGIDSVDALEGAARDGRLNAIKGYGPKTTEKFLKGIELYRASRTRSLYHRRLAEARALLATVREHPGIVRAEIAGSVRRNLETVGDVDIVAACSMNPREIAASFARTNGVRKVEREGTASPGIIYADGTHLDLHCVKPEEFTTALWRATGSEAHVEQMTERLSARQTRIDGDVIFDAGLEPIAIEREQQIYELARLPYIPPEMREEGLEFLFADGGAMPLLLEPGDIRGSLHNHSTWSDGKNSIEAMARASIERGWDYIGITDHSQGAFYAGGMSVDQIKAQHDEIDRLGESVAPFRILKGIECDILADGRLDYDDKTLETFDFIVGSIHSRFSMDEATMTARILGALGDPRLTILGHPTGRLLLSRRPAAMNLDAILEKAAAVHAAVELNADTKRLDLDWRTLPRAIRLGATIAIGPDAHSVSSLDNVPIGVAMARKAGLQAKDVLNTRSVDEVLAFAAARRENRLA